MFELLFTIVYVLVVTYFDSFWFSFLGLIGLLILILPGLYGMLFGAPFIISSKKRISSIFNLVKFDKNDVVVELGCGDARIIRKVASLGVKNAIGYEFSVPTYFWACFQKFLNKSKEKIIFADFWKQNFEDVDVLICFLLENTMLDFEKKIWPKLKKGAKVVSNEFKMKSVTPDREEGRVYLYVKK